MANFSFDTATVAPRDNNFELLPAGTYVAQVTDSEIVPLASGNGTCLKLTVTVLQEGYNGRKIFCRLNVEHTNPMAEKISQQQLHKLCDAIGLVRMQDTVELHNKPFIARVKIAKSKDPKYDDQNEISGFKPATGGAAPSSFAPRPAAPATPAAAAPAGATPAAGATPPWARKAA